MKTNYLLLGALVGYFAAFGAMCWGIVWFVGHYLPFSVDPEPYVKAVFWTGAAMWIAGALYNSWRGERHDSASKARRRS